nr:hypothetical protein [Pandoravirus aubagnensis]
MSADNVDVDVDEISLPCLPCVLAETCSRCYPQRRRIFWYAGCDADMHTRSQHLPRRSPRPNPVLFISPVSHQRLLFRALFFLCRLFAIDFVDVAIVRQRAVFNRPFSRAHTHASDTSCRLAHTHNPFFPSLCCF